METAAAFRGEFERMARPAWPPELGECPTTLEPATPRIEGRGGSAFEPNPVDGDFSNDPRSSDLIEAGVGSLCNELIEVPKDTRESLKNWTLKEMCT
jgi:hypothetical protein